MGWVCDGADLILVVDEVAGDDLAGVQVELRDGCGWAKGGWNEVEE